jgi:hypothetical protein
MRSSPYRTAARHPAEASANPEVSAWVYVLAVFAFAAFVWLFREPGVAPEVSGCFAFLIVIVVAAASAKKRVSFCDESPPLEQPPRSKSEAHPPPGTKSRDGD